MQHAKLYRMQRCLAACTQANRFPLLVHPLLFVTIAVQAKTPKSNITFFTSNWSKGPRDPLFCLA